VRALNRLGTTGLVAVFVAGAAIVAWLETGHDSPAQVLRAPAAQPPVTTAAEGALPPNHPPIRDLPTGAEQSALPPNHPAIGGGFSLAGQEGVLPPNHPRIGSDAPPGGMPPTPQDPPSLAWKVPSDWQEAPNPSSFRLATYRVPGGAELSIARAGGSIEANIQRWLGQFDNAGADAREQRMVRGMQVTMVQVAGTYEGSSMAIGGASQTAHPDWSLLAAIVEATGSAYFFKMLGPTSAVRSAHKSFDTLVASFTPR
jgi:hypothetical protein